MCKKGNFLRLTFVLALCVLLFPMGVVIAQTETVRINIDQVDDSQFPKLDAYVAVLNAQGLPIEGLTEENFTISEDGKIINDIEVSPIDNAQQPLAIVIAVDTSISMQGWAEPTPMTNSKNAAKEFVSKLNDQDQVAVISFSDVVEVTQDLTNEKSLVVEALDGLEPIGNTALYDSIVSAVDVLKNRSERKAIILLTDGKDYGNNVYSFDQAVNEAARWSIPIYPIGFGQVDQSQLQRFAELTGGFSQIQPDSLVLGEAFDQILGIFREQYQITYSSGLPADGLKHDLLVELNYQSSFFEQTRQFLARPGDVQISFNNLMNDQVVGGQIKFEPQFISPAPIANLVINIDGENLGELKSGPFELVWDSTMVDPGLHDFQFVATDASGNVGETTLQLNVRQPVIVDIENPEADQSIRGLVTISTLVDSLAKVSKVEFKLDGKTFETLTEEPYEFEWDTSKVSPGSHTLTVLATDVNGFTGQIDIPITVSLQSGSGIIWLVSLIVLGTLAVIVPLSLRKRRKLQKNKTQSPDTLIGRVSLRELEGLNPNTQWPLSFAELRLGRKKDENDIPLKGVSASRFHAVISVENEKYKIVTLNPENPIQINGNYYQEKYLEIGDELLLGESKFQVEAGSANPNE